jgi:hypothetical protein
MTAQAKKGELGKPSRRTTCEGIFTRVPGPSSTSAQQGDF